MTRKKNNAAGTAPAASGDARPDVAVAMPAEGILQARLDVAQLDPVAAQRVGVRIIGPATGRRRAGRAFGTEPVEIALLDLSEDELRAIDADPLLSMALMQLPGTSGDAGDGVADANADADAAGAEPGGDEAGGGGQ